MSPHARRLLGVRRDPTDTSDAIVGAVCAVGLAFLAGYTCGETRSPAPRPVAERTEPNPFLTCSPRDFEAHYRACRARMRYEDSQAKGGTP